MASTNKTTNYELSQYVGSDKPTYLTDYNQDMAKIDAGIHAAKAEADQNKNNIGTLSNLTTESKASLVAAINEIDAHSDSNTESIVINTNNISNNATAIGTLANLDTSAKNNLVAALNEVNAKTGTLSNLETDNKSNLVAAINEIATYLNINKFEEPVYNSISGYARTGTVTVATNNDGSLAKIYGEIDYNYNTPNYSAEAVLQTSLRPTSDITIAGGLIIAITDNNENYQYIGQRSYTIHTDGRLTFNPVASNGASRRTICMFDNSLLFIKDFGDVPSPTP